MSEAYLAEIAEQPGILDRLGARFAATWGAQLAQLRAGLAAGRFDRVILTGMGGSLHGAHPAHLALSRALAVPVMLWESGELTQQAPQAVTPRTLLIAISQSGESGEVKRLTELPIRPAHAVTITNGPDNALANWADLAITTEAGPERTASTKTYTAGLAALHLCVAHLTGEDAGAGAEVQAAAAVIARMLEQMPAAARAAAAHLGHDAPLTVIGRGDSFGTAAMAALLIEEAAKLSCEALTGGQFRHGPLELVRMGFRAVVFTGDGPARPLTEALVTRITELGGRVVTIGTAPGNAPDSETDAVLSLDLPEVAPGLLPLVEIIPVQYLVIPLALARGFEPAAFLNARKITTGE
ncbi:SIS domain-containing protein [Paracoccus sp. (in: a-proteobacteria)]|uniref:SIS domain-containing protein n=1 Tax=Paracoccus sp. TaxID=267 RepID=UPI0035AF6A21